MSALSLVLAVLSPPLGVQAPSEAKSTIEEVTVFPGSALVRRHVDTAGNATNLVVRGLPVTMDPETLRVRCEGAEVLGIEWRDRRQPKVPDERVEALRERERELRQRMQGLEDEIATSVQIEEHLGRLLQAPGQGASSEGASEASIEALTKNLEFLTSELGNQRRARREVEQRRDELGVQLADVTNELGGADPKAAVPLRDVYVELSRAGATSLDLEYVVSNAGWDPLYDLRTAPDAATVELGYRAKVWQLTGEDWNEVELALSTAQPHLGAQGPDPEPIWLRVREERARRRSVDKDARVLYEAEAINDATRLGLKNDEASLYAGVESQGLSVRFRVATKESVQSRREPSTVLIGNAIFPVVPEYVCLPEVDSNVWLRGKATNSSPWTLLPGRAAVYFGADFLGHAELELVQPEAEITLHLGPDPAFTVERTQLADKTSGPGFFGTKASHKETFRVRLKNNGAAVARADGTAVVNLREVLPKSTDERIKVELDESSKPPATDERWKTEREEKGIVTWTLTVPRGGETTLEFTRRVAYPDGADLRRR